MIGAEEESVALFPIRGRIDSEGRLVEADPPLAALHSQGGGRPGGAVAIPQLAALARLVSTLRVGVSRPVATGGEGTDIDLFVRANPDADGVVIEIVDWVSRSTRPTLQPRQERHHDFVRAGSDFSWAIDADLILSDVSPEVAALLGSTVGGLVGQPFARLFTLIEASGGALPMVDAITDRTRFESQQARLRGSDLGLLDLAGAPKFDLEGNFKGYTGTATRIDEVDSIAIEVEAAPSDEGFGIEIGRVLKGPLDRIIANADVIRSQADGPLRKGYSDYAADIAAAGRHLMSLVDDLMELQTIEQPDFRPDRDELDLCDIARRAAGLLAVRASDSGVTIDRPDETESLAARGEFRRVLQILVNLLGNAVRHSPPGGTIWVRAEAEEDKAVLIVADQGAGISAADQQRIFEKFERLGLSDTSGSGLGLYISRKLARAMSGDLTVDSAPGQGARFILTLPRNS